MGVLKETLDSMTELYSAGLHLSDNEKPFRIKKGEIIGEMIHDDGRVERIHHENIIVDYASLLVAQLLSGGAVPGITHLAVGTGYGTGTQQNPQAPTASLHSLQTELSRKAVSIIYNQAEATVTDGTRTNVLDITAEFGKTEAVGPLTEMGLFGGAGADLANGGTMVNMKRFAVWNKPNTATLRWTWRITT